MSEVRVQMVKKAKKYVVPSMAEINRKKGTAGKVCSLFSGGGGSSLGYKMAGFSVVYANEFVEEARATYKANFPKTYVDGRDIRTVTPEDILEKTGLKKGELDVLDGSPPCCAFSMCGKRDKKWGKARKYSDNKTQVVDDLFFEYIRILDGLQPKVFVAENVKGLVVGAAKGYFNEILKKMRECGYVVNAAVINSKWLGVPQARERTIFIGVRKDLGLFPVFPKPHKNIVTLKTAFEGVENSDEELEYLREEYENAAFAKVLDKMPKNPTHPICASSITEGGAYMNLKRESLYTVCSTVCQRGGTKGAASNCHPTEDRKFTIPEVKRIMSIPDDFILTGNRAQQWERAGRMVPPLMMKEIAICVKEVLDEGRNSS